MTLSRTARIAIAIIGLSLSSLLLPLQPVTAQDQPPPDKVLSAGEIDALVAPVALYPDQLLAKVLIASTYPLEVVEADRWAASNASLKGSALDDAVAKQSWDDNVKSLAATPTVLKMMSERLDWTQKLGDTFLSQEKDVTDAVQRLRRKAQEHGTLKTTAQQTVTTQNVSDYQASGGGGGGGGEVQYQQGSDGGSGSQVIVIEPSEPNTVYVPYYDTQTAYGSWPYPSYPPYSYPPPYGYGWAAAGLGFLAGAAIAGGWWNSGVGWGNGGVYVNHNNFNNFNRNNINNINRNNVRNGQRWNHNVNHRKGVGYGNNGLRDKYGRNSGRGANGRQDFRGRGDANRVANNLGGRNGVGNNGIGNRNGVGNNRGGVGNNGIGGRNGVGNNGVGGRNGVGNNGVGNRNGVGNNRGGVGNNGVGNNRGNYGNNRMASNPSRGGSSSFGNRGGGMDRSSYGSGGRGGGFDGVGRGSSTRQFSSRGSSSMRSSGARSSGGGMRSSGGGRGGGGGGRGGGGRRR